MLTVTLEWDYRECYMFHTTPSAYSRKVIGARLQPVLRSTEIRHRLAYQRGLRCGKREIAAHGGHRRALVALTAAYAYRRSGRKKKRMLENKGR